LRSLYPRLVRSLIMSQITCSTTRFAFFPPLHARSPALLSSLLYMRAPLSWLAPGFFHNRYRPHGARIHSRGGWSGGEMFVPCEGEGHLTLHVSGEHSRRGLLSRVSYNIFHIQFSITAPSSLGEAGFSFAGGCPASPSCLPFVGAEGRLFFVKFVPQATSILSGHGVGGKLPFQKRCCPQRGERLCDRVVVIIVL